MDAKIEKKKFTADQKMSEILSLSDRCFGLSDFKIQNCDFLKKIFIDCGMKPKNSTV